MPKRKSAAPSRKLSNTEPPLVDRAWEARIKTDYRPVTWDDAAQRFFGTIVEVVS